MMVSWSYPANEGFPPMKIDDVALQAMIEAREASGMNSAVLEALRELWHLRRAVRGVLGKEPGAWHQMEELVLSAPMREPDAILPFRKPE